MTITTYLASHMRLEISERKLLLRLGDISLVGVGSLAALVLWSSVAQRPLNEALLRDQLPWMLAIGLGWLVWMSLNDLYNLRRAAQYGWCLRRIVIGCIAIGGAYVAYFFLSVLPLTAFGLTDLSVGGTPLRLAPAAAVLLITALLVAWRGAYALVLGRPHASRRVLVLGAGAAGTTIAGVLQDHTVFEVVGFIDDDADKAGRRICDVPVLGDHSVMADIVATRSVDEIVVAISDQVKGSLFQAIMDCHERGASVTPMPLLYEQLTGKIAVEHIGSQWYVALPFESRPFNSFGAAAKRMLDVLCGLVIVFIFLVLLPFIALAIKLNSPGPVFYLQERMGIHGKVFRVIKFRSMVTNAERDGHAQWATKNDSRVTQVGKIMRKTRLDELPQVINVLRGEMSMVGPRPERPQFIDKLQRQIPFYRTRLTAKPGLTGWAQVSYGYGSTVEDALIKLQYDLYYIKHQSLWFDLKILLSTLVVVLRMKGQ